MTQSHIAPSGGAFAPTPFADLNDLLADWLKGVRAALGETFVGAWLQGSFALGEGHEASDCDFTVAVTEDLDAARQAAIGALHADLFARPGRWSHRLEGAYVPVDILRRMPAGPVEPPGEPARPNTWRDPSMNTPPLGYPMLFLGAGESVLVRSEHDNSQVIRWILREHGLVLAGPPAADLIDPVTPEALRSEVRGVMRRLTPMFVNDPKAMDSRWLQAFLVILYVRMLHTLQTGLVASKGAAAAWGLEALDARWKSLITAADALRRLPPEDRQGPADRAVVAETLAFLRQALRIDAKMTEQRAKAARLGPDPSHSGAGPKFTPKGAQHGRGPSRSVAPPSRPLGGGRRV